MACKVKTNRHGLLAFRLFWDGISSWEGTHLKDTPENRELVEAQAVLITDQMKRKKFDYIEQFPNGNKAYLFRQEETKPLTTHTVKSFFNAWIKKQGSRVRPHRVKEYQSHFNRHILKAKVGKSIFGKIHLAGLKIEHLKNLQDRLRDKGLKATSVNAVVHSSLRAFIRDARVEGLITSILYDRDLFKPLPLTDVKSSVDPYTPEEREIILERFRTKRPHYFAFVYWQFWTGSRPSEALALRHGDLDLRYSTAKIERSRVQGHEAGTKTLRSNREIRLHSNLLEVLRSHTPFNVNPEDYIFTTPQGTPIDQENFYRREWLPMLRKPPRIRPRPFYNTRHSYASFLFSIGAKPAFVSSQTGDTIRTLEKYYAKYLPQADSGRDLVEETILKSETKVKPEAREKLAVNDDTTAQIGKPLISQGLRSGAGDRGRTDDLMLGKHTL